MEQVREKSAQAFRTISEVSEELDTPAHVLRFWESKFHQVNPLKRGGGRRYYRPADVALLRGIRALLYDDGLTIKGLQKVFRERGVKYVVAVGAGAEPAPPRQTAQTDLFDPPAPEEPDADSTASAPVDHLAPVIARLEALRDRLRAA
ncbi:MAG: MerR family transcriptional regulator [Rhodobacteraceae bacterium]|nr:MAG: MerR family transcriptional regulator [Paracoccaceae bacterium]